MGAFAYLTKPFQLETVEDTVVRAIARGQERRSTLQQNNDGETIGEDTAPAADASVREQSP